MECAFCEKEICGHSFLLIATGSEEGVKVTCTSCGAVGINEEPPLYCLPTYEGEYDPESTCYSTVCRSCHDSTYNTAVHSDGFNAAMP